MLARITTFALDGLEPRRITVEVDVHSGLPSFTVVGLADRAVREARERVRAALVNSGFEFPLRRITANLAPAAVRKVGPGFDLALAIGVLVASNQLACEDLERWAIFGELSLGGQVRPCRGTLAAAEGAKDAGLEALIVPRERAAEAALVEDIRVAGIADVRQVVDVLRGAEPSATTAEPGELTPPPAAAEPDLADVRGHEGPIAALVVAAAGGHNLLMQGPPGTGKTMLARRLPGILPPLSRAEALEVTRIHSVAGAHAGGGLVGARPFRAPHHTISASGLVGGGAVPVPGEVSLSHHGVLFLDELSEFSRGSLEALRQPLEDARVAIVRGQRTRIFPSSFMLVAATNPCPCGYLGDGRRCRCTEVEIARYRRRLSGPLLDRIDLLVTVNRPSASELRGRPVAVSATVRERIVAARERMARRLAGTSARCNGDMDAGLARRLTHCTDAALATLYAAYDRTGLTTRGQHRVLRVARTIADLADSDRVLPEHMHEALAMRQDDLLTTVAA